MLPSSPLAAKLGDECSVGMGCVVGKGASLGSGAALAAGSIVKPGTAVPANQLWGGNPAAKIGDVSADSVAGVVRTAQVTHELAKIHMAEAWKDYAVMEEEAADYKREKGRTVEYMEELREDPKWLPLPTLGENLAKMGIHSNTYTPP